MSDLNDALKPLIDWPTHEPPPVEALRATARRRSNRRRAATALFVVVAVALPLAIVATRPKQELAVKTAGLTEEAAAIPAGNTDPGLPVGFDPGTAPFVFTAEGTQDRVVDGYFKARLSEMSGDIPTVSEHGLFAGPVLEDGRFIAVPWWVGDFKVGDKINTANAIASGMIYLRNDGEKQSDDWGVIAATTKGVDVSAVRYSDGRVSGTVTAPDLSYVTVDVLVDGKSITTNGPSTSPDDHAGISNDSLPNGSNEVAIDVPIPDRPADSNGSGPTLMVQTVDGAKLSITEVVLPFEPSVPDDSHTPTPPSTIDDNPDPDATEPPTTVPPFAELPTPPWAAAKLATAAVPATLEAWKSDGSPGSECPALAPADLGEGNGATARSTDRGKPDAWYVAYDLAGAPGEAEIQDPTADAGKDTFSVSAIRFPGSDDTSDLGNWPNQLQWSDGSVAGYGIEGGGDLPPIAGVPDAWLAYIHLTGSPCLYQVHSYLGRTHLEHLIDNLRFVEGTP